MISVGVRDHNPRNAIKRGFRAAASHLLGVNATCMPLGEKTPITSPENHTDALAVDPNTHTRSVVTHSRSYNEGSCAQRAVKWRESAEKRESNK